MEYHRDDRYLSEIEVLLVLDKGPADTLFHEGHSQGPYPTASPTKHLQLSVLLWLYYSGHWPL